MLSLAAITLALAGALDWTAYSPLDVALDIEQRKHSNENSVARVYAARGEFEGIHLAVTAKKKGLSGVTLEAPAPAKDVPPPVVYRILPLTGPEIKTECLDVLQPALPADLEAGQTIHYWIRYAIPANAKAGVRQSTLRLVAGGEHAVEVPVRLEIFDFELPAKPSLPNIFYLDRGAMRHAFDLKDPALDAWKPFYAAMGGYRLGFSLWDGTGLAESKDLASLKEHLAYAADATNPAALDLAGGNGVGWRIAPKPEPGQSIDALNLLLNGAAAGIKDVPLTAAFDSFPARAAWPQSIGLLRRLSNGSQLLRVGNAPLHPEFQAALDAWALPFRACGPQLLSRLSGGAGLGGPRGLPAAHISATESGDNMIGVPYRSSPEDAADGSPFTAWFPLRTQPGAEDVSWQADFDAPVYVDEVVLLWLTGHETKSVELFTTLDGTNYAKANVKWDHKPAPSPAELPSANGKLRFPAKLLGIRAVIHLAKDDAVPALAEVAISGGFEPALVPPGRPIKPWLALELDTFPTTYPGRPLAEPRMIGWVCWFGGLEGLLGASLNVWPNGLLAHADGAPYELPKTLGDYLFYPINGTLQPSMRLERLRDGLEDYEYLRLLSEARTRGDDLPADAGDLLNALPMSPTPTDDDLQNWAHHILETRIQIGRALGGK